MHQLQHLHPQRLSQRLDGGDIWKAYTGLPYLKTPSVFFKKSFYLADKAIVNLDFLVFGAVWVLDGFVDQDLFNQGVEQFRCQFCGVGVLLDEVYPLFSIGGTLLLSGKSCLQRFYFPGQLLLFRLIFL